LIWRKDLNDPPHMMQVGVVASIAVFLRSIIDQHRQKGAQMTKATVATMIVWAIIFVVPVIVYGIYAAFTDLKPPGDDPMRFLLGVGISKFGTALAFVLVFYLGQETLSSHWFAYAGLWFAMFAIGEIGQAVGPDYSWAEAIMGIISEAIYFPASGLVVYWMLRNPLV
jgi:hypothetical protein